MVDLVLNKGLEFQKKSKPKIFYSISKCIPFCVGFNIENNYTVIAAIDMDVVKSRAEMLRQHVQKKKIWLIEQ